MENQPDSTAKSSADALLETTVAAFDAGNDASPQAGSSLINDWISLLDGSQPAATLVGLLTDLQTGLQETVSNDKLKSTLEALADQTGTLAETATGDLQSRLNTLAQALRNFSAQLSTAV